MRGELASCDVLTSQGAPLQPRFDSACWRISGSATIHRLPSRVYLHWVSEFAKHFHKPPDQLGPEHVRKYQLFLIKDKQASQSTCVQLVCAVRVL